METMSPLPSRSTSPRPAPVSTPASKKWLYRLSFVSLVVFILAGSLFAWLIFKGQNLDRESKAASEDMIRSVCGSWDVSAFHKYGSAEFLKAASDDRLTSLTTWFSKNLGPLKSHDDLKGESKIFFSLNKMRVSISAQYTCEAVFEKDKAILVLALSRPGDTWQMVKFDIQSDALIRDTKDSSAKTSTKP